MWRIHCTIFFIFCQLNLEKNHHQHLKIAYFARSARSNPPNERTRQFCGVLSMRLSKSPLKPSPKNKKCAHRSERIKTQTPIVAKLTLRNIGNPTYTRWNLHFFKYKSSICTNRGYLFIDIVIPCVAYSVSLAPLLYYVFSVLSTFSSKILF